MGRRTRRQRVCRSEPRVTLPAALHVGGHLVSAEQKTALGTLRDVYSFNVSVQDEAEERD